MPRDPEPEGWDIDDDDVGVVYPTWPETVKWMRGAAARCVACGLPAWTPAERALAEALCEGTHYQVRPGICQCCPVFMDELEPLGAPALRLAIRSRRNKPQPAEFPP